MSSASDQLTMLIDSLNQLQTARYGRMISNTIIMYDYLITIDREVNVFWGAAWSLPKVLFFLVRYFTLVASIFGDYVLQAFLDGVLQTPCMDTSHSFYSGSADLNRRPQILNRCNSFIRWELSTAFISAILAEAILQLRIYALYRRNQHVLAIMLVGFVISMGFSSWIFTLDVISAHSSEIHIPWPTGGETCVFPTLPPRAYVVFIPIVIFEALLCGLVVIRGIKTFKSEISQYSRMTVILNVMVRDSVIIFIGLAITYLACLVVWLKEANSTIEVPSGFSVAFSCVLGYRVLLNTREAATQKKAMSTFTS
ncbi:hypothetical protein CPC08DRAFT_768254 [Agrocybe pediades]|nr:hypothetical protein CPC08DRAFT_768254 [Agrocybe pediades]